MKVEGQILEENSKAVTDSQNGRTALLMQTFQDVIIFIFIFENGVFALGEQSYVCLLMMVVVYEEFTIKNCGENARLITYPLGFFLFSCSPSLASQIRVLSK